MARIGLVKSTNMFLLRGHKRTERCMSERCMSKHAGGDHRQEKSRRSIINGEKRDEPLSSCWVPHPRTGIYFPKGQERVMDEIPNGAASLNQAYWLRNVDGVDRADPNTTPDHLLELFPYKTVGK